MGALADGTRREALKALREHLAASIEVAEPKEMAALSRQMVAVLAELDGLPPESGVSLTDEFTKRLEDRRAKSAATRRTGVGTKRR